ncbi:long-chain fatty acid--CoA ligase [Aldersonia sp. NBC_00410]|uniref:class I adenylate-forming enzyme family protein n=1 Tax=Aldersonia sp. NBC_00410 TaxID=2975954 RepID=UPI00225B9E45|nr:long-chain fatty acid--CoA ligase [Aldersonia sp. NBC_00410]MCX5043700.1 long-chain fatty acid--CoA ligase [Aldersonia sp. NBC_00410]
MSLLARGLTSPVPVEYPLLGASRNGSVTRGPDGVLRYGDLSPALTELLDVRVHRYANRVAVVEIGGPSLTYRELWGSAARIAGGLNSRGIGYGDRVGIRLDNGARWVQAFLGALLSGAVPVPVNDRPGCGDAAYVLDDSAVDFVLDDDMPDATAFIDDGASLGEVALLCYTNGTHGRPKGVELSNENLLSTIESVVDTLGLVNTGMRNLMMVPLAHASGCVDQLLPTLAVGGTVVIPSEFGADALVRALRQEQVDVVATTADVLRDLCTDRVPTDARVTTVCCSGGALTAAQAQRVGRVFPAASQWSVWGATETSGIGLALSGLCPDDRPGFVGAPFGGTELALLGPDAEHGVGELLCRGPNVTRGYWNNPEATAQSFTGNWFHTGDQVEIDRNGFVRLTA